jgi:hypothetical protein
MDVGRTKLLPPDCLGSGDIAGSPGIGDSKRVHASLLLAGYFSPMGMAQKGGN